MSLKERDHTPEMLDAEEIPYVDLLNTLNELDTINTLLGGHTVTIKGLLYFLDKYKEWDRPIVIAEIGCGGGDNLAAIRRALQARGIRHHLIGIDMKPLCTMYAARKAGNRDTTWICSDYALTQWPGGIKPDIIFSSLFCHHFTDAQLAAQLEWMRNNSNLGFFINDIHRHPAAYWSIKILTALFSRSAYVKNDAQLSVKRAFIRSDWKKILQSAGIKAYRLTHQWAFRYLVCVYNAGA